MRLSPGIGRHRERLSLWLRGKSTRDFGCGPAVHWLPLSGVSVVDDRGVERNRTVSRENWRRFYEGMGVQDALQKAGLDGFDAAQLDADMVEIQNDPVNHPDHYTNHPSGVECIQITEHMSFCLGNAVKYIWRADLKGNAVEDLEKAEFYVRREIARRKAGAE
jgi:hypothetical protein